jgi:protein SCO1/2
MNRSSLFTSAVRWQGQHLLGVLGGLLGLAAVLVGQAQASPMTRAKSQAMRAQAVEQAQQDVRLKQTLEGVGIDEKLGERVAIESFQFRDEENRVVPLSQYFQKGKPVIVSLAYYQCPTLCTFVLTGLVRTLRQLQHWVPGKEFEVVNVSISPKETAELAAAKKKTYLSELGKPGAEAGMHFLTGEETQIQGLAKALGFKYRWVPEENQYAHGAAVYVLTPEGRISRILYGIEYGEQNLRLALLEASNGKIGTVIDRLILFCYRYDATTRTYSIVLTRVMQAGSAAMIFVLGGFLAAFWLRQRKFPEPENPPPA